MGALEGFLDRGGSGAGLWQMSKIQPHREISGMNFSVREQPEHREGLG